MINPTMQNNRANHASSSSLHPTDTMPQSDSDPRAWLILAKAPGIGPVKIRNLLHVFGSPEAVIAAPIKALQAAHCPPSAFRWIKQAKQQSIQYEWDWLQHSDNALVSVLDSHYPNLLRNLHDAPSILFVKGNIEYLNLPQLAIVGSRNPTADGQQAAIQFSEFLARGGLTITSGLAQGIDAQAHRGALRHGATVAVCATGLDSVYPKAHHQLATEIVRNGCLVSEFLPGTKARREFFPRRNRLISGLSIGTLVIEAGIKSGSLITAHMALEQGREVFAIPGSIHNPLAKGCHQLIKQGAKLVETAEDIIEELHSQFQSLKSLIGQTQEAKSVAIAASDIELDEEYQSLLTRMDHHWLSIDDMVELTGQKADNISSMLLILELDGRIQADGNGRFRKI